MRGVQDSDVIFTITFLNDGSYNLILVSQIFSPSAKNVIIETNLKPESSRQLFFPDFLYHDRGFRAFYYSLEGKLFIKPLNDKYKN